MPRLTRFVFAPALFALSSSAESGGAPVCTSKSGAAECIVEADQHSLMQVPPGQQLLQTSTEVSPLARMADAMHSVTFTLPNVSLHLPNISNLPGAVHLPNMSNMTSRIANAVHHVAESDAVQQAKEDLWPPSRNPSEQEPGVEEAKAEPVWEVERFLALAAVSLEPYGATDVREEAESVLGSLKDAASETSKLFEDHVPHLLDAVNPFVDPKLEKKHGMLVHVEDIAKTTGIRGEEMAKAERSFQGDMVAESEEQLQLFQRLADGREKGPYVAAGKPWTEGRVKYCFASDVVPEVRSRFVAATGQIERATCMTFEDVGWQFGDSETESRQQRCTEQPAIFVMSRQDYGCYSVVGESWLPSQQLQLQHPGCTSQGVIMHELGHALGMAHEHSRPDRDEYIKVNWDNVRPGAQHDFDISPDASEGEPYEYLSIMHYDQYTFSKDRSGHLPTIEALGGHDGEIGQRSGFAQADIQQLIRMYTPEVPSCSGRAINGTGCVNMPGDAGDDVCSGLLSCGGITNERCCACGGGVEVQCYDGEECLSTPQLPREDRRDCLVDMTAMFVAHGDASADATCIVHNQCDTELKFKCQSAPCTHSIPVGAYQSDRCRGERADLICTSPETCEVWDVAEEALYVGDATEAPEVVVEEPEAAVAAPEETVEVPDATAEAPEETVEVPEVERPEATVEAPEKKVEAPSDTEPSDGRSMGTCVSFVAGTSLVFGVGFAIHSYWIAAASAAVA